MSSYSDSQAIKSKVQVPAILLIVVGVINILIALYWIGSGVVSLATGGGAAQFKQEFEKGLAKNPNMTPEERKQAEQFGNVMQNFVGIGGGVGIALGVVAMLCSAVMLFGGLKMMSLQSYGLAMTGTVLAMIPCLSPCCLLGLVPGIWGLVVLMSSDVKGAFR